MLKLTGKNVRDPNRSTVNKGFFINNPEALSPLNPDKVDGSCVYLR